MIPYAPPYPHTHQVPWYAVLGNHDYGDTLPSDFLASRGCPKGQPDTLGDCQEGCCVSPLWQVTVHAMGWMLYLHQCTASINHPGDIDPRPSPSHVSPTNSHFQVRRDDDGFSSPMAPGWHVAQGAHRVAFGGGILDVVFVDTPPFIKKYRKKEWADLIGRGKLGDIGG